ncbi:hypothetical protein GWK47_018586 [Chionoecetes opilio]|uniref:Uncharacterized protein n=1 Tax=Chionoecetes opilio TaxID=41210 RepID=A0A8J5CLN2_CHIOP|nr:hypothetical protein GWK47_018586 [Chionoecetes opilio]
MRTSWGLQMVPPRVISANQLVPLATRVQCIMARRVAKKKYSAPTWRAWGQKELRLAMTQGIDCRRNRAHQHPLATPSPFTGDHRALAEGPFPAPPTMPAPVGAPRREFYRHAVAPL